MQTSSNGNSLEVKKVQKDETLSSASPENKKIGNMTQEEMFHYEKYVQAQNKISFSNERRKSRRIAEMQIRNKKKEMEKDDGKVQAAAKPAKEMKIKNPCTLESSKTPIFPKAFPIYSKNNVCGYLYMNNNQTPPTKVTLANIGASMTQTLPNSHPLKSAVDKPVVTPSKPNVEFLNNVDTLLLNDVPINPRMPASVPSMTTIILPKMINTSPLSEVQKPMDNNLKLLTRDIPIQPKTSNTVYLIPVGGQSNDSKQSPRKFILLSNRKTMDQNGTNLGSTLNNPTESNNLLPLVNHGANNKTDNSVQSISSHSSEPQDSKVKCKLKTIDQISIKKEPTEMEDQYENKGRQSELEVGENVHLSSDFIIEKKKLNDEYEQKQKICKTEPVEEEEGEEGCGLVISSTFSLSDFSQLHDFI